MNKDDKDDDKKQKPFLLKVFKNGDDLDTGLKFLYRKENFKEWVNLLDYITSRMGGIEAVNKLHKVTGEKLKDFEDIEEGEDIVAVFGGKFMKADYGGERSKMQWNPQKKVDFEADRLVDEKNKSDEEKKENGGKKKGKKKKDKDDSDSDSGSDKSEKKDKKRKKSRSKSRK